jgi:nucleoside-diphosphate-sugar epimerase
MPENGDRVRIVVTGATGNIGTALLRQLDGGHDVVGIARRPPTGGEPYEGVTWVAADLTAPNVQAVLAPAMAGADAVVHLAWGFQPSHDETYLEQLGVGGTRAVLTAAAAAGVRHLVHMSSVGAYSPRVTEQPVDEGYTREGVPSSPYSRHKVAAEQLLDEYEASGGPMLIARLRPGIVGQRAAGSALLRYGVPAAVPASVVRHIPLLPLDRRLLIPVVHADDVADAIVRVLDQRATGAFNLASEPPLSRDDIAHALGAYPVHLPAPVLRLAVSAGWHARVQKVDPGWLDLGMSVPVLDTSRARRELGWAPTMGARAVLDEVIDGLADAASGESPALRPRTVVKQLATLARRGPSSERRLP